MGKPFSVYIKEKKMQHAAGLLKDTALSCSEISYRLGYSSQSYFCKQFREMTGMTPTEYREKG